MIGFLLILIVCLTDVSATPASAELVKLVRPNALTLVEGDGQDRHVKVDAFASREMTINISVDFSPLGASYGTPGEQFIIDWPVTGEGSFTTVLPKPFERVGRYWIKAKEATNSLLVFHQPKGYVATLFSISHHIGQAIFALSNNLSRALPKGPTKRISDSPAHVAVWIAKMPQLGTQVPDAQLHRLIPSAMMPSWSADGRSLVCAESELEATWNLSAYTVTVVSSIPSSQRVWQWKSPQPGDDLSPVWSPTGRAIAFLRVTPDKRSNLWLLELNADGRPVKERALTTLGAVQRILAWRNTDDVVFQAMTPQSGGAAELLMISTDPDAQAPAPRLLGIAAGYGSVLGWNPIRGTLVYAEEFLQENPPRSELRELHAEQTEKPLLVDRHLDRWPAVSPDGNWVAFDSDRP